jgi:hypothetical protein
MQIEKTSHFALFSFVATRQDYKGTENGIDQKMQILINNSSIVGIMTRRGVSFLKE